MTARSPDYALIEYVVGFALDRYGRVALICKNRPEWQAGLLNGIGGHVEAGEDPDVAMKREFEEETGARVDGWRKFVVMDFPGARIHFYKARVSEGVMDLLRTTTDEQVIVLNAPVQVRRIVPNLSWLLPLAMYTADDYDVIHVRASMADVLSDPRNRAGEGE